MQKKNLYPMPARYLVNLVLVLLGGLALSLLRSAGIIDNYWNGILTMVGINILLASSLNIPVGYLGQLPLGHAGFMAIGGYAAGIFLKATPLAKLLKTGGSPFSLAFYTLAALLLAGLVAGFFGFLIGVPALRLRGDYLAIITLGFGEIIRVVLTNIDDTLGVSFTYGAAGLKRIPKFTQLLLVYAVVAAGIFLIHVYMKSRHGRAVLSIRENEIAAESVGINTTYYKTYSFAFSAALAGVAGALYAGYLGSLYPTTFTFMKSIEILVMVVLGGMGSMLGSVLSAGLYTILQELMRNFESYRMVVFALLLILMMVFRPKGLLGDYDFSLSRLVEKALRRKQDPTSVSEKEAASATQMDPGAKSVAEPQAISAPASQEKEKGGDHGQD